MMLSSDVLPPPAGGWIGRGQGVGRGVGACAPRVCAARRSKCRPARLSPLASPRASAHAPLLPSTTTNSPLLMVTSTPRSAGTPSCGRGRGAGAGGSADGGEVRAGRECGHPARARAGPAAGGSAAAAALTSPSRYVLWMLRSQMATDGGGTGDSSRPSSSSVEAALGGGGAAAVAMAAGRRAQEGVARASPVLCGAEGAVVGAAGGPGSLRAKRTGAPRWRATGDTTLLPRPPCCEAAKAYIRWDVYQDIVLLRRGWLGRQWGAALPARAARGRSRPSARAPGAMAPRGCAARAQARVRGAISQLIFVGVLLTCRGCLGDDLAGVQGAYLALRFRGWRGVPRLRPWGAWRHHRRQRGGAAWGGGTLPSGRGGLGRGAVCYGERGAHTNSYCPGIAQNSLCPGRCARSQAAGCVGRATGELVVGSVPALPRPGRGGGCARSQRPGWCHQPGSQSAGGHNCVPLFKA
jgi:hypothetical protein